VHVGVYRITRLWHYGPEAASYPGKERSALHHSWARRNVVLIACTT